MDGYTKFRNTVKDGYKNKKDIGLTLAELVSIKPVTLEADFEGGRYPFVKFLSCIPLEGLKEEDVGKRRYLVYIYGRDNVCYIICEYNKIYDNLYIEDDEE